MKNLETTPDITRNAITLIDAQNRIDDWRNRIKDAFGTTSEDTPISMLIPFSDLQNIVEGFANLPNQYTVTGARLYLTFSPEGPTCISGILVPVGNHPEILTEHDILLDVVTGMPIGNGPVDPNTKVSVYDFTHPCPPLGCLGTSLRLTEH